jgi:hypothetical protein
VVEDVNFYKNKKKVQSRRLMGYNSRYPTCHEFIKKSMTRNNSMHIYRFCLLLTAICLLGKNASGQVKMFLEEKVPFDCAVQVANQVCTAAVRRGALPDTFQFGLSSGNSMSISTAQALGLLAEAGEAIKKGTSSELALCSAKVGAPVAAAGKSSDASARSLATGDLLSECSVLLDFTEALGALPSAIWISGKKLSMPEFLTAIATAVQYLSRSGKLPDQVEIIPCSPPASWLPAQAAADYAPSAVPTFQMTRKSSSPTLKLSHKDGAKLSGKINFVAILKSAAPETVVVSFLLDGQLKTLTNWAPYSFQLDTGAISPGKHRLAAMAEDASGKILASKEITIIVKPRPAPAEDKPILSKD